MRAKRVEQRVLTQFVLTAALRSSCRLMARSLTRRALALRGRCNWRANDVKSATAARTNHDGSAAKQQRLRSRHPTQHQ